MYQTFASSKGGAGGRRDDGGWRAFANFFYVTSIMTLACILGGVYFVVSVMWQHRAITSPRGISL